VSLKQFGDCEISFIDCNWTRHLHPKGPAPTGCYTFSSHSPTCVYIRDKEKSQILTTQILKYQILRTSKACGIWEKLPLITEACLNNYQAIRQNDPGGKCLTHLRNPFPSNRVLHHGFYNFYTPVTKPSTAIFYQFFGSHSAASWGLSGFWWNS